MQTFQLQNGINIPAPGYGTWRIPDGDFCVKAVKTAIAAGYRHIDTAAIYGNEKSVGKAIRECSVDRRELFITSKLWNTEHSYDKVLAAFEKSLNDLQLDYLDLYLIHWPCPLSFRGCWEQANNETWIAFEKLYRDGRVKAIGVSNFTEKHLTPLLESCKIKPMVNQIEISPGHLQTELTRYCQKHDIIVEAWAPFAVGRVFALPEMQVLSAKYDRPMSQILLSWYLSKDILPIVKSITESRILENIQIAGIMLEDGDANIIERITADLSSGINPDTIEF